MISEEDNLRTRPWAVGLSATAALGACCVAYGSLIERNWFTVRQESLPILPPGSRPLRILHLSDIHLNVGQNRKIAWLQNLTKLHPDLVVNTGDNLTHREAIAPLLSALRPLMNFPGVFVPGSNDYYAPKLKNPATYLFGPTDHDGISSTKNLSARQLDTKRMHDGFEDAGWINLTNRSHSMPLAGLRLDFSGVDDPHLGREKYVGWPAHAQDNPLPSLRIAVVHAPYQRVLNHFTDQQADLILAGHTHGGQLRLPGYGALLSNCDLPPAQARGLSSWRSGTHQTPLNVSGGIGTSRFAPIRFACRPEAVLLTLSAPDNR